jgi:hypothetical protein
VDNKVWLAVNYRNVLSISSVDRLARKVETIERWRCRVWSSKTTKDETNETRHRGRYRRGAWK